MKLLVLMPSFPSPTWGAGTRNYNFLKVLATRHTVSLICLVDNEKIALHNVSLLQDFVSTVKYVAPPTFF